MTLWYLSMLSLRLCPLKWRSDIYPCFVSVQFVILIHIFLLFLLFDMGNGGAIFGPVVVVCSLPLFTVWIIWPGKSRHCMGEGYCPVCAASSVCKRVTEHFQTLPLALIGWIEPGAADFEWNYGHWVEPQTVDFHTADLSLFYRRIMMIILANTKKKYVTDYSFNGSPLLVFWPHMF